MNRHAWVWILVLSLGLAISLAQGSSDCRLAGHFDFDLAEPDDPETVESTIRLQVFNLERESVSAVEFVFEDFEHRGETLWSFGSFDIEPSGGCVRTSRARSPLLVQGTLFALVMGLVGGIFPRSPGRPGDDCPKCRSVKDWKSS